MAPQTLRRHPLALRRPWLSILSIGLLYGAGTSILNHGQMAPLSAVLGHGVGWACLGLLFAWWQRRQGIAVWRCGYGVVALFGCATFAYYATDTVYDLANHHAAVNDPELQEIPDFEPGLESLQGNLSDAARWLVGSVLGGVLVTFPGVLAARRDVLGWMARLSAPLGVIVGLIAVPPTAPVSQVLPVVVLLVGALLAWAWMARNFPTLPPAPSHASPRSELM